ncbi:non-ribosomal peptide synthase/polyketide synthase [Gordonia amicalis]|uniref:non-ribosomal peptide synthase/polyketide synthase n=1 Tax=Gordonia amicalis TaxID=89053 RepID=UPI003A810170
MTALDASLDRPAIIHGDRTVSRPEFDRRVARLARELTALGVGAEVAVGIQIDRSVEQVVAIHAVAMAGGHFVPLDEQLPVDRARYMVRTAGVRLVVVTSDGEAEARSRFDDVVDVHVLDISTPGDAGLDEEEFAGPTRPANAAFTLFTSGSTGRPKAVVIAHRGIANRLAADIGQYDLTARDVFLYKAPITFDVSVREIFLPIAIGATLVIAEPGRHGDPVHLADLIRRHGVTVIHFVPAMLAAFNEVLGAGVGELTSLRLIQTGGEALTPPVARDLMARLPGTRLQNQYGPAEASIVVTIHRVTQDDRVIPIGTPTRRVSARVLDAALREVPIGVPGELYLGGVQLARGYAGRPDLTAERFVADPFGEPGARLYRTGDRARWNRDGEIEYLGRTDFQVKLRGQRLELGEVEAALAAAPGVLHAAAAVVDGPGGQQLVGYLAPADVDVDTVAATTAELLPEYMRPSAWVRLDAMPLNRSGKVDRRLLPEPVIAPTLYVPPGNADEETVAGLFAELLDVERVGVTDSFFDIGGSSLSAARIAARVSKELGVDVSVRDVFESPSVRGLVHAVSGRGSALPSVKRIEPRPERLPLSRAQRRMWFLNQFDTASGAYNIPAALTLAGDVDETLLFDSLCDVVERHEVLRTVYPSVGAAPVQDVLPVAVAREQLDWREADSVETLVRSTTEGFDVSTQMSLRGRFHRDGAGLHVALTMHHIAMDGQSIPVLARDLMSAYAARAEGRTGGLPVLDVQYADYALWQQSVLGDADDETSVLGEQLSHWRRVLAGLPAVTDLPMDRPRPAVLGTAGATVTVEFDDGLADRVDVLARSNTMTAFMVTEAAFAATVARLSSSTDVVIGTPIAGRNDAAVEDLIGMFVNTLLLRTQVDPGRSVGDLLGSVRTTVLDAFANDQVQFDDLIETLAPERSSSYQPLAQIAFTYTEAIDGEAAELEAAGIEAAPVAPGAVNAKFDLTVAIRARSASAPMAADFIYATDLFDESTVERFAEVYRRVLTAVVENQDIAVGDIDIVGAERVESAPAAAVAVRTPGAMVGRGGEVEAGTLIDVLAQRDLDPDHPALICDGTEIDYDEFETRTNAIARALLARGVSPEDVVAVGMERSIGSVLATWGVIKSGAAYVPVDPAYPADRIAYMLDDSGATVGITDAGTRARLGESVCEWVDLADLEAEAESGDDITDAERNGSVRLTNLAYLIYTSGSTGRPKAVGVSHTGIVDFVNSLAKITTGTPEDEPDTRILHVASPSFDASMFEMAWAIPAGHTLVIAPHTDFAGDALAEVLDRDEVTDMIITPSVLATVDPERAQYVRNLATGGEACPPELVERWSERGRRIFNCYGPTEATVWATRSRLTAGKPVTIGKPVDGFTVRVLDGRLHEVPQGVVGELYLSTAGLARGYLGRPGQTSTSFVADPFGEPGTRMYATGDLVRVAKGGNLEFAGRADHQVKINGQRVELGEIEVVLDAQPGVAQSVVVGVESTRGGRKHTEVVAYLVAKPGATIDSAAVLDEAARHLAAHMVPAQAIVIDEIPLTPAGKLDRTALPEPHAAEPAEFVAPADPAEENLARIVAGLLGEERVSVTESFFALGGDSIMSIQLSSASKAAGIHLSPREIFELKTIRAMAAAAAASGGPAALIEELPGGGSGDMPLPPVTSWMIEHSEHPSDFADFSQSLVFNVPRAAAIADLQTVVEAVAAAHPMLTAVLTRTGDAWTMTAGAGTVPAVREIDAAGPLDPALVDAHRELLGALDPETGSLFGTAVVNGEGRRRLVIAIHHLGVDAVSWPVLVEDLVTAWAQLTSGRPIELRPEGTSARRIAHLLADQVDARAAEVDYWLEQLPVRPTSFGDTADQALHRWRDESSLTYVVDDVAGPILTTVPQAFGSSVDDVLLGALARAVRAWQLDNGIADDGPVTVSTEGHGRDESIAGDHGAIDLSRTVGWFTSITPLAVTASSDVVHAVKSAKDARLSRPAGGVGFGILRYNSDGEIADRPLPTIMYNFFGGGTAPSADTAPDDFLPVSDRPNMPSTITGAMRSPSVFGINISTAGRDEKRLEAKVTYATDVLDETAASDIARRWHEELRAVAALVDGGADIGLSRADVPGVEVTQDDLDLIAEQYPGADVWPMTPLQQGLFFQADLASTVADHDAIDVYVTQTVLSLTGDVDPERLRAALGELLARQRVLRSGFVRLPSGAAVTVVPAEVTVPWSVIDLRAEDAASHESRVDAVLAAERATPFDMAEPPLIRVVLVEHRDGAELVVTNHHLLIDGWSSPLVLADLLSLYATGETFTGSLPDASGRDFADHARAVATTDIAAGLTAWREVLAPVSEPTLVAPGHEPSADAPPRDHEFALDVEVTERLEALARDNSTTMSTVVQFAWAVFLSRLTGTRTVTFAETVSGRSPEIEGIESMVGMFINTIPAVVDVDPDATVVDVLTAVQNDKVKVLDHQQIGLPMLAAQTGLPALFDTLAVYESFPVNVDSVAGIDASSAGGLKLIGAKTSDATHYPLNLSASRRGAELALKIKYLPTAFAPEQVAVFADVLSELLGAIADGPDATCAELPLLSGEAGVALTPVTGGPAADPVTLTDLFRAAVRRAPDDVALVDGSGARLTYRELDEASDRLARWLIGRGVGPERAVALAIGRSAQLLTAIWAVAKTGGAYVPIDPDYPAERVASMIEDSGAVLGLSVTESGDLPARDFEWVRLDDDSAAAEIAAQPTGPITDAERLGPVTAANLAYVIYTSGSTGRPKGVAVSHSGLANFARQEAERLDAGEKPVVLGFASPSFDASVLEYLLATVTSGTVAYRPSEAVGGPALARFIAEHGATHTFLTPSVLSTLDPAEVPSLRVIAAGGEAVPQTIVDRWSGATELHNLYGPTETTIGITISPAMEPGAPVRLGGPIGGVDLLVLDERLRPVPVGMPGELYVAGVALSRGYLDRSGLTAERFTANPYGRAGQRMYRTGDVVRWTPEPATGGLTLEYTGRSDDQVKLRGLRIELGEIEAVLAEHDAVESAVVLGVGGSVATALAAYIVPVDGTVEVSELKAFAGRRLPGFMVPSSFTVIDELPLTPVGKLDKRALPEPVLEAGEYVAPAAGTESTIADVVAAVLGIDAGLVSATSSFFELGGDSLSAARLAARLSDQLGVAVSVRDVFEAGSVRALAEAVGGMDAAVLPPVGRVDARPGRIPLSFAQQRMWFINKLDPSSGMYNIPALLRVSGSLDVDALRVALGDVVARHEVLRTTFPSADGEPFQVVHGVDEIAERLDWRQVGAISDVEAALSGGFALEREWPVRARVLESGPGEHVVAVVMHHIASDGESLAPLVTDLVAAYLSRSSGESPVFGPLDVQYADYAIWQRNVLGSPDDAESVVGRQLAYWTEQLAGLPDVLELPADRARPQAASGRGVRTVFEVPSAVAERVRKVAEARGMTPFMVLHAALAVTLSRLSATDDIAIGTPIAGRGQEALDPLVGMFVNTLVLRTVVDPGTSFSLFLQQVHKADVDAFANADVPFEAVVDAVDPVRSEAFTPLAQVMLVAAPKTGDVPQEMDFGDLRFAPVVIEEVPAQRDLTLYVEIGAEGVWSGSVVAATDLFDASTAQRMSEWFVRVLDVLSADPSVAVGDVDLLSAGERVALAQLPSPVTQTKNAGRTLVDLFTDSVVAHGDRVAVSASGRSLSYAELDARSDAVAAGLAARGVAAGDLVGIATARSVDLMASILGVLKVGAGYLPLDLGNPVERLSFIVSDAEVSVVIGDASSSGHSLWRRLPVSAQVVDVEVLAGERVSGSWAQVRVPADARAYVIYTSGSTGRPKGVEITHRDVVTLMDTAATDFEFLASDVWTMFHSYAFDFSVWEMWGPLLTGARLLIVDRELARDPRAFVDLLAAERVTVLSQTPSAFYQLIDARREADRDLALRYVVFGGEALSFDQVRRWFDEDPSDSARLVNMYGITETTVHVSFRALDRDLVAGTDASLIGRPLASLGIHILDDRLHPVPEGVPGEMYVTGGQLAAGYLKRPGLSATRFVADPFAGDGSRMYRTGDRARRIGDDIEYLGRGDAQVQLRGFRIEFGEIEAALLAALPTAAAAAARVITDAVRGDQLVGYLVVGAGEDLDTAAVRSAMAEHVPGYMVPDAVVAVERLPLNHNGKLDRKALPEPEFVEAEYVAPASPAEETVAAVYVELLGLERVGVTESFFDLGGNSLLAARLAARVSAALGVEVSVRDVFDASSVRELVTKTAGAAPALPPVVRVRPRPELIPLSYAQQRMWFINKLDPASGMYNIPVVLRVSGDLDVAALRTAMGDVVSRHETLRTTFPDADGTPFQLVHEVSEIAEHLDVRHVGSVADIEAAVSSGFVLAREWPVRVRIWEAAPREHVVAVVMHHIASDGESFAPLVSDLVTAYLARSTGESPVFAPLEVSYADFALWQREVLGSPDDPASVVGRQLAYWTEQLAGLPDVLELPTDRPRPQTATGRGAQADFAIPAEIADGITKLAAQRGVTPYMVVHAALAVVLARLSGSDDLAIGSPFAGRGQRELEPLIGMFVNTLVLRSRVDGSATFTELLADIRDTDLAAFAHADVAFESVVEAVDPVRSAAFAPLTQVWLSVEQGAGRRSAELPNGLVVSPFDGGPTLAKVDLGFGVHTAPAGDPWSGSVTYATDLFDESTVRATADRLIRVLSAVVTAPEALIGDIELLDADERSRIEEWSGSTTSREQGLGTGTLADLVERVEPSFLHSTAVIDGDRSVDYEELTDRTNALARRLIGLGVGPDVPVAISLPRSIEMVIASHAVIAAGGHFVPVGLDAPAERVRYILDATGADVLVVSAHAREAADRVAPETVRVVEVDASAPLAGDTSTITDADRTSPLHVDHAMYTIFTSGSTGKPKGVTVSHRAAMATLHADHLDHEFTSADVVLAVLDFTFDPSVLDLFRPVISQGTLVIVGQGQQRDPWALRDYVIRHRVTSIMMVPSMLSLMLGELSDEDFAAMRSVRTVQLGGEALAPALADAMHRVWPQAALHNQYGPTETVIYSTIAEVGSGLSTVPIGVPTPHGTAQILDARLHPVPVGVPGELYLGGIQIARGYIGRPGLTAERFVADPSGPAGSRMYRTGDTVRWRADGQIEYLGRIDFQVKLRGQRIELGEIESVIASAPGVREVVVTVLETPTGAQSLVAYVTADTDVTVTALRGHAADHLLPFMRPAVWTLLDDMPVNAAGKVDRERLPAPDLSGVEYVAPVGPEEEAVAAVFADILGVEKVSVTESFFDLGGTSLNAARLAARVSAALDAEVRVRDVFDAPSVRELVEAVAGRSPALPPITAVAPRPDRVPLSFAQQRMWFINRFEPDSATYNLPNVLRLSGPLDVAALRAAFVDLAMRHEVLRTRFPAVDGVPYQEVADASEVEGRFDWDVAGSMADIQAAVTTEFDLAVDWPIRVRLWPVGTDEHVLAIVIHHIAADGESLRPLIADVVAAYSARHEGFAPEFAPLGVQFADFAIWQHEVLGSPEDAGSVIGKQLGYWREALAGMPDLLELPYDRPRPRVATGRGGVAEFAIPEIVARRIGEVATRTGATPFMVLDAALATLLARMSATDDIAIATPIAGRGRPELDPLIGMFVNTLVLRSKVDLGASFVDLVARTRTAALGAFENADVPFETVVDAVNPVRSEAFAPLAQVMLTLDPGGAARSAEFPVGDLVFSGVEVDEPPAQVDLTFMVNSAPTGDWGGAVVFAADLFDESTVSTLAERFVALLDGLTFDVHAAVGDVPILGSEEAAALTAEQRGLDRSLPTEDLASALAASVAEYPDREALVFGDRSVTYGELGARVNTLARQLIAAGIGPDVAVAVCIPRSVELMVAIHAIVTAGGQYVPIDTGAPVDRAEYMVETSGATVALVHAGQSTPEPIAGLGDAVEVIGVDTSTPIEGNTAPVTDADRRGRLRPQHAAYTIFTSGSTGRPKGVTLPHDAVVNRLRWGLDELPIGADDMVVLKTPYTFDCSVAELFGPLMQGSRLLIAEPDGHLDPPYLADLIADTGATMVHFVPSMLSVFLELAGPERLARLDRLRILSTTGEALPPAVAAEARAAMPDAVLYNLYGPTEAAVEITYQQLDEIGDTVPIGVPVWNSTAYVLDGRLHQVPSGVPGELYVGGAQLARGYAARPDLTADRFLADPFGEPGSRMYRTGDLVRRNASGELEYLGRTDFQVKLRGQRIELGEIEAAIAQAPGVVHTAVTVAQAPDGGEHLVAYVSGAPGETVDLDAVKAAIATPLPEYMRPTVWMPLDEFPLNTAGKLDRKSLPAPEFTSGEYVAPATDEEARVAEVFAEVLGVDRIGVTDSFFDMGGNSLSAMRLASRAGAALGVDVSVRDVFGAPSVRELVAAAAAGTRGLPPIVAVEPRPDAVPVSFAQQRMWFINQFDWESPTYNIPAVLRLTGPIDLTALRAALADVVVRHESLRTTFPAVDGLPLQRIHPASEVADRLDWTQVTDQAALERDVMTGFDVSRQWPIRARVLRISDDEHVFALVVHHIAADGESVAPLVADLVAAYVARTTGAVPEFAPLPVQYADYALWQHEVLGAPDDPTTVLGSQLAYWREKLAGLPDVIDLPTDRPRPTAASGAGARVDVQIPAGVADRIAAVAHDHGVTNFMVVHAALATLLSRLSGTDDIAIGTPIAGRGQEELDRVVGMFVNTLVLRTPISPAESFGEVLSRVKSVDVEAFAHADVPFETVVDALKPARSGAFAPLSQVWLTFDQAAGGLPGADDLPSGSVGDLAIAPLPLAATPAKVDLLVSVAAAPEPGAPWRTTLTYATDLFDESSAQRIGGWLVELLDTLTSRADAAVGDALFLDDTTSGRLTPVSGGRGAQPELLAETFERAARSWPQAVAVVDATGKSLTYEELDARSNRLARWLIGRGIGPESLVALAIGRSVELLTAIWAVAKTGGGYVPIDPDYPAERVANMVEDSGAVLGLTTDAVGPLPDEGFEWYRLGGLDLTGSAATPVSESERLAPARIDNTAYVIYTSGSTGRPKGVSVSHSGLANFAREEMRRGSVSGPARVLGFASPSFDASVLEYLLATASGGLIAYRPADAVGGAALEEFMVEHRVTHTFLTPTVLSTLDPEALDSLELVYVGGEAVPQALKDAWSSVRRIQNLYGPTETTIGITISEPMEPGEPVLLGGPLAGLGLQVLDSRLHPVPVGVPGELYVTGLPLSRGYLNRPGLTADRFVADPFGDKGSRMYRTGDVVRWNRSANGALALSYSGRTDDQVKLRGLRIELGEIESALAAHPAVDSAVVVGVGGAVATSLAAYLVTTGDVTDEELREFIGRRLPSFMVPATLTRLDSLPMTPVGKLDKAALPEPVVVTVDHVEPETDNERAIAEVFAEVLGVDRVSATESFFDLGGNSLSATQVVSRVHDRGLPLELRWLFSDPTVRELARRIEEGSTRGNDVLITLRGDGSRPPLFCVHPAGGLAWFYGGFAPYIADRPIYGLQDPHVVNGEDSATDAHELAARYVQEIRRVQPEGPYHLLGWSIGGIIAHAMATRLQAVGERVAYLGIMDTAPPGEGETPAPEVVAEEESATNPDHTADILGGWRDLFDLDDAVKAESPEEVADIVRTQIAGMGLLADDVVDRVMDSFAVSAEVLMDYRPQRFDGSIQVFTATNDKTNPAAISESWQPHVSGTIDNTDVATHHLGMTDAASLGVIGPRVEQALSGVREADADSPGHA